jgi:hypothetical protein
LTPGPPSTAAAGRLSAEYRGYLSYNRRPMSGSSNVQGGASRESPALAVGIVAWLAAMALYWPQALSFGDDVGYLGEAKLFLAGHILPGPRDPGIWTHTAHGLIPQYPLLGSLLLAPLLAIAPRAAFALGILAAVAMCWTASRILRSWGTSGAWALVLLAHPSVVILARTVTADIPLAAFTLGAWWALRQNKRAASMVLFGAMFAVKPPGFILGFGLVAGEWMRIFLVKEPDAQRRVITALLSIATGFACVFVSNELSAGSLWFAYDHGFLGTPPFWYTYLPKTAPTHLRTLFFFPPLLILGAMPYWRRRELGPLCLIFGFGTMMCFYFFVDRGTTWVESLVLSPRLLLPVVVFLLVGYAELLARVAARLAANDRWVRPLLIAGTASIALAVSARHHRWQAPMADARAAAERIARQVGSAELGLAPESAKAGLLFPGPTPLVSMADATVPVVLCSTRSASYRAPDGVFSCDAPGYRVDYSSGGFEVLVRVPTARAADGRRQENDLIGKQ